MKIEQVLQIREQMLGDYSVQAVSARALYEALELTKDYSTWIKKRITAMGLVQGEDYDLGVKQLPSGGKVDHIVRLSWAKKIAMTSNSAQGDAVREYFLACEATVQKQVQAQITVASSVQEAFQLKMEYLNAMTKCIFMELTPVMAVANAIEAKTTIEQETGESVVFPNQVQALIAQNPASVEYNGESAFAAKVAIGSTFTTITSWSKQYKHVTPTDISKMLISQGFAFRANKSSLIATNLGSEFANSRISEGKQTKGKELTNAWNLNDTRFTDVMFPALDKLERALSNAFKIKKLK